MKKMKHMLVFVLVFAMLLSMAPMAAARAEGETTVTEVSNEADFRTAVANGGVVKVTSGIRLTGEALTIDKEVTLTADSAVTITTDITDVFTVTSGGKLTLNENITVKGESSILWVKEGGQVVVNGAVLESSSASYTTVYVEGASSALTVENGTIAQTGNKATIDAINGTITINGGVVSAKVGSAVCARVATVATIAGGEVKTEASNLAAAYAEDGGELKVTGGKLSNAEGSSSTLIAVNGGIVIMEAGSVNNGVLAHGNAEAKVTISGTAVVNGSIGTNNGAELSITSGTFTVDPSDYVVTPYVVTYDETNENYIVAEKGEEKTDEGLPTDSVNTDSAKNEFKEIFGEDIAEEDIAVDVITSLDVNEDEAEFNDGTFTVDIIATYEVIAYTDNQELVVDEGTLDTKGTEITVTVQLPDDFDTTKAYVYVKHYKNDKLVGTYPVTVDESKKATFVNKDGFSTFEFYATDEELVEEIKVYHNLSLNSEIDFNFAIAKADLVENADTTLTATITHGAKSVQATWNTEEVNGVACWRFNYVGVAAKEMGDDITLVIKNGEEVVLENTYSVAKYAEEAITNGTNSTLAETMQAMLYYGAAAQQYFNYNATTPVADLDNYVAGTYSAADEMTSVLKHNLTLNSRIDLSFAVAKSAVADDVTSATIDGTAVAKEDWESATIGGVEYWRFRYSWVAPKNIFKKTVAISAGDVSDSYSVASYAIRVVNSDVASPELKKLMNTLLDYGTAADALFTDND